MFPAAPGGQWLQVLGLGVLGTECWAQRGNAQPFPGMLSPAWAGGGSREE